jgi:hypothetical protein
MLAAMASMRVLMVFMVLFSFCVVCYSLDTFIIHRKKYVVNISRGFFTVFFQLLLRGVRDTVTAGSITPLGANGV